MTDSLDSDYLRGRALMEAGKLVVGSALLESAAAMGDANAATYLGYALLRDTRFNGDNSTAARQWFLRGSDLGCIESEFQLGLLENDAGNLSVASSWFNRAASRGHIAAAQRMGYLALHARDLSESEIAAGLERMSWAASQGHAFAMRDMSRVLLTSKFGKRNIPKAIFLRLKSLVTLIRIYSKDQNHELIR